MFFSSCLIVIVDCSLNYCFGLAITLYIFHSLCCLFSCIMLFFSYCACVLCALLTYLFHLTHVYFTVRFCSCLTPCAIFILIVLFSHCAYCISSVLCGLRARAFIGASIIVQYVFCELCLKFWFDLSCLCLFHSYFVLWSCLFTIGLYRAIFI